MADDIIRELGYLTLGSRLKRLGERLQAQVQTLMDQQGLTFQSAQFPVLAALSRTTPLSVGELSEGLGVSQPGITRSIGQLAAKGLVKVRPGGDDKRTKLVSLTPAGQQIVKASRQDLWPLIEQSLSDICTHQSGDLLANLSHLEDQLALLSLDSRVVSKSEEPLE